MKYVRIRSWHVVTSVSRSGLPRAVRCGAPLSGLEGLADRSGRDSETLPLGEPSCESCARLVLHDADPKPVENGEVSE